MPDSTQTDDKSQEAAPAPVQLYRFRVKTADGREMVSAVAVVDPNSTDANQADPKDSLEALDQQHKQEADAHDQDLASAHESESAETEKSLDANHDDVTKAHLDALDTRQQADTLKNEAATDAAHGDELAQHATQADEKAESDHESLLGSLDEKAKTAVSGAIQDLNVAHVAELAKQGETKAKGFFDKLAGQAEEFAKKHVGDVNGLVGKLVSKARAS
jgi:hypothetical protein